MALRFELDGLITARPFNGPGWSVERQLSAGCAMMQPHRRWHVLSYYPEPGAGVRRKGAWGEGGEAELQGRLGLYPAGEAEAVAWRGDRIAALHIHIAPERIAQACADAGRPAMRRVHRRFVFEDWTLAELAGGLYELARFRPADHAGAEALMDGIIAQLASSSARPGPDPRPLIGRLRSDALLDLMHGAPAIEASVDDLAAAAGLSRRAFFRRFRQVTGASPHDHLVRSRVELAKALIQEGRAGADIALSCGFSDQPHFTNAFRARIGLAPGAFAEWFAP